MAKAKRVHSTPRQTAQKPVTRDEPMKAPGCHWEFWNGAIGLSTDLSVFEAGDEVGTASNLPDSERIALANYMIDLWTQVRDQHHNVRTKRRSTAMFRPGANRSPACLSTSKRT
jgi:hypothetical protein